MVSSPDLELKEITTQVISCTRCPRLVDWREQVSLDPPSRYKGQAYWAKPVPGWGDPSARLLIVGLAPAAHGGNRTGRIFTGDRSGDWLFRALHKAGFANQPQSTSRDDGLELFDCYIAAAVRCAPPMNKPLTAERDNCLPFLVQELAALSRVKVIVALGGFAWNVVLKVIGPPSPRPRFGHGASVAVGGRTLIGSFHPSQQNTFTGKLTESAFDDIFSSVDRLLKPGLKGTEDG
ncbi:MAG: uracil-DNA glycosylase [Actinomycetota bacterium]